MKILEYDGEVPLFIYKIFITDHWLKKDAIENGVYDPLGKPDQLVVYAHCMGKERYFWAPINEDYTGIMGTALGTKIKDGDDWFSKIPLQEHLDYKKLINEYIKDKLDLFERVNRDEFDILLNKSLQ